MPTETHRSTRPSIRCDGMDAADLTWIAGELRLEREPPVGAYNEVDLGPVCRRTEARGNLTAASLHRGRARRIWRRARNQPAGGGVAE